MRHNKLLLNFLIFFVCYLSSYGQKESNRLFEASKGKWPIPVSKYTSIVDNERAKYAAAYQFDSILRIVTDSSVDVFAVHDATIRIISEEDNKYYVVTDFADYCILYACLLKPSFREGDKIKAGQIIGKLAKYYSDEYVLELVLYRKGKQLSPLKWIKW